MHSTTVFQLISHFLILIVRITSQYPRCQQDAEKLVRPPFVLCCLLLPSAALCCLLMPAVCVLRYVLLEEKPRMYERAMHMQLFHVYSSSQGKVRLA